MYLRGLLDGVEPKNSEAIAGRWAGEAGGRAIAQALQHFLGSSPWDAGRFLARSRSRLPEARGDLLRVWVVQDVVFPKKGRHSVGTQPQLARTTGRKINCQVAVAVSEVGPDGFLPLAIRLYLPGTWLREHRTLAERLVPAEHRENLSKAEIAIRLIDELSQEGRSADLLTADGGFLSSHEFIEAAALRKMQLLRPAGEALSPSDGASSFGDFAPGSRRDGEPAVAEGDAKVTALARQSVAEAERGFDWLRRNLGLDQFEGRNWLGWHHHAALVLAAYWFHVLECGCRTRTAPAGSRGAEVT